MRLSIFETDCIDGTYLYIFFNSNAHIVEKNPSKFKIDNKELTTRKHFIDATREEVKVQQGYL